MQRTRELVDAHETAQAILAELVTEAAAATLEEDGLEHLGSTVETLTDLHTAGWNGIWCSVLADRFAAGAVPPAAVVAGNPPWVKWSHLPPAYADFIKPHCIALGVFSEDTWVGGIESDISTVITYTSLSRFCENNGTLAFFITGTVFASKSSQGFRRWRLPATPGGGLRRAEPFTVVKVEDFAAVAPFEGVSNHPALLILRRNRRPTRHPVTYRVWKALKIDGRVVRTFVDAETFRSRSSSVTLRAQPVPGSDAGPWLKGTATQLRAWTHLFGSQSPNYRGRKGVTTDANGVFFVKVEPDSQKSIARITNDPSLGRRRLQHVRGARVEREHLYPLLRGQGVAPFRATPDPDYCILLPQHEMNGDPDLVRTAPGTYRYLNRFRDILKTRSSYRRFQARQPWWSLWNTGPYTFAPFKVAWQEMSGGRFAAAFVGSHTHPGLERKVVVPDHKVYFVPLPCEEEAAFLTGFLNAPLVAAAVSAYAAALSLGVSVVEYLLIPNYDARNPHHAQLAELAKEITALERGASAQQELALTALVAAALSIPADVLADLESLDEETRQAATFALRSSSSA